MPHPNLLRKLELAGVSGPLLSWFNSYLTDRRQSTLVNGTLSTSKQISSGVVQGSVLGPSLFLLYINDVLKELNHGVPFLFADDIKVVYKFSSNSFSFVFLEVQRDLDSLSRWSRSSGLHFSEQKCHFFSHKCSIPPNALTINDHPLNSRNEVRDLGLRYSVDFNFSSQVEFQVAKATSLSFHILRNFHLRETRLALFVSHIRPLLEFCPSISGHLTQGCLAAVERVQRRFTKLILSNEPDMSYESRCNHLRIAPLWKRRLILNLTLLHKFIYDKAFIAIGPPVFKNSSQPSLRNSDCMLSTKTSRTSFHFRSFFSTYPRIWNKLPVHLRSEPSTLLFHKQLRRYLTLEVVHKLFESQLSLYDLSERGPP